jgi:hypothetical protein
MIVDVYGPRGEILDWLSENVGEMFVDVSNRVVIGRGWRFEPSANRPRWSAAYLRWTVFLTDERLATLFLLRWT